MAYRILDDRAICRNGRKYLDPKNDTYCAHREWKVSTTEIVGGTKFEVWASRSSLELGLCPTTKKDKEHFYSKAFNESYMKYDHNQALVLLYPLRGALYELEVEHKQMIWIKSLEVSCAESKA